MPTYKRTKLFLDMAGRALEIWPKLGRYEIKDGDLKAIGAMPAAMESGKPAVGFLIECEGRKILAHVSLKTFQTASAAFVGEFGDVTEGQTTLKVGPDGLELENK